MDMIIHSYGYGQTIFNTLNSLAMIRQTSLYPAMITTISLLVGVFYSWQMAASRADGEWRRYILKLAGMLVLINALLLPQTSMNVKDHVEKQFWRVDHIPLAFALPVGIIEEMGHLITVAFEQAFLTIGGRSSFSYYDYGMVFGGRLAKEVSQIKVRNPEYVYNMRNFIDRCVMNRARIGVPFSFPELYGSDDLWALIRANPGTFTRFAMMKGGVMQSPAPTCKEGVVYFETMLTEVGNIDIASMALKFKSSGERGKYNNTGYAPLSANLKRNIQVLYGLADEGKVDSVLKHNMLMNAMNDYRAGLYPAVKAQLQQEAGGLLSGDMAETVLTSSLAVMKNIAYASFIFLVPLILVAGGMSKYKNWIVICLSLQLWPALYAVLNMMIDYAYDPVKVISYSAWATETKRFDSMASVAANLTMLIPFLAIWLTKLGEGGFMQLAGSIMATANSATASASAEKASGSRSWDNDSIGNSSRNNVSENKFDDTRQYVSGTNSSIQSDGSTQKVLPNGSVITTSGAGATSSVGEASYREGAGMSAAIQEGLNKEMQAMNTTAASYSKAQDSLISKEASALSSIATNKRSDTGYNIDTSTEEGKEFVKGLNAIDRMTESNEYSWQQNAEAHLKADASFGKTFCDLLGLNVGAGGSVSAQNSSTQSNTKVGEVSKEMQKHEKMGANIRTSNNESVLESLGVDKTQQEGIRESYNQTKRLEEQVSAHQSNIDSYNKKIDYVESHNNEFNRDMTQEVIEGYKQKYNVGDTTAAKEVLSGSAKAQGVFRELSSAKVMGVIGEIQDGSTKISSSPNVENLKSEKAGEINTTPGEASEKFAEDNGMRDRKTAEIQVDNKEAHLKTAHEKREMHLNAEHKSTQDVFKNKIDEQKASINSNFLESVGGEGSVLDKIFNPYGKEIQKAFQQQNVNKGQK